MSNIVLMYFDNTVKRDIAIESKIVLDTGTKLDGSLNIKLFSELDDDIGTLKFPIKTDELSREGFNLSLDRPQFISKGKRNDSVISSIGTDATFTEIIAEIINDLYSVNTNLSYSEGLSTKINDELEKIKNI